MSRIQRRDNMIQQDLALEDRVAALEAAQRGPREWTRVTTDPTQPVSLTSLWTHYDLVDYGPAEYRIIDDNFEMRGALKLISGSVPATGTTPLVFLAAFVPSRHAYFPFINQAAAGNYLLLDHTTRLLTLGGAASTNFLPIGQVKFSFMPATAG